METLIDNGIYEVTLYSDETLTIKNSFDTVELTGKEFAAFMKLYHEINLFKDHQVSKLCYNFHSISL